MKSYFMKPYLLLFMYLPYLEKILRLPWIFFIFHPPKFSSFILWDCTLVAATQGLSEHLNFPRVEMPRETCNCLGIGA